MNWNTIYITGSNDFWEDVHRKVKGTDLNFLQGHSERSPDGLYQVLYWLDSRASLRDFKMAIGGKLIWKYRLRFFLELELINNEEESSEGNSIFTAKESALINSARKGISSRAILKSHASQKTAA